jgi:hypothetical protein
VIPIRSEIPVYRPGHLYERRLNADLLKRDHASSGDSEPSDMGRVESVAQSEGTEVK